MDLRFSILATPTTVAVAANKVVNPYGQGIYRTAMRITSKKIKQYINKRAKNNT